MYSNMFLSIQSWIYIYYLPDWYWGGQSATEYEL